MKKYLFLFVIFFIANYINSSEISEDIQTETNNDDSKKIFLNRKYINKAKFYRTNRKFHHHKNPGKKPSKRKSPYYPFFNKMVKNQSNG